MEFQKWQPLGHGEEHGSHSRTGTAELEEASKLALAARRLMEQVFSSDKHPAPSGDAALSGSGQSSESRKKREDQDKDVLVSKAVQVDDELWASKQSTSEAELLDMVLAGMGKMSVAVEMDGAGRWRIRPPHSEASSPS